MSDEKITYQTGELALMWVEKDGTVVRPATRWEIIKALVASLFRVEP